MVLQNDPAAKCAGARNKLVLCKKLSKYMIKGKLLVRVEIYAYRVKLDRRRIRKFLDAEMFTRT